MPKNNKVEVEVSENPSIEMMQEDDTQTVENTQTKPKTNEERWAEQEKYEAQLDVDTINYLDNLKKQRNKAVSDKKQVVADDCKNVLDSLSTLAEKKGMSQYDYTKELIRSNINPSAFVAYYNTTKSQQLNALANMPETITNEKDLSKAYEKYKIKGDKAYFTAQSKKDERGIRNYRAHKGELEDLAATSGKTLEEFEKELISKGVNPNDFTWNSIESRDKSLDSFKENPQMLEGINAIHERTTAYLQEVEDRKIEAGSNVEKLKEVQQESYTLETLAAQEGLPTNAFISNLIANGVDPKEYAHENAIELPKTEKEIEEQLETDTTMLLGKLESKRIKSVNDNKDIVADDQKEILNTLGYLAGKKGLTQHEFTKSLLRDKINPEAYATYIKSNQASQLQKLEDMPKKIFKDDELQKAYIEYNNKSNKEYLTAIAKGDEEAQNVYRARNSELEDLAAAAGKSRVDFINSLLERGVDPDEYAKNSIENREKDLNNFKEHPELLEDMAKAHEKATEYLQSVQDRKKEAGSDQVKLDELQKESDTLEILAAAEGISTNTLIENLAAKGIDPKEYVKEQIKDQETQLNEIEAQQNKKKYEQREQELAKIAAAAGLSREELGKVISNAGYEANQYSKFVPGTPEYNLQVQKLKEAEERKKQIEADKKFAEELKAKEEALQKKEAELQQKENELTNKTQTKETPTQETPKQEHTEVATAEQIAKIEEQKGRISKALDEHRTFTKEWNDIRELKDATPDPSKKEALSAMQDELEAKLLGSDNKYTKGKEVGKRMGLDTQTAELLKDVDAKIGDRAISVFGEPAENFPGDPNKSPQERKNDFINGMLTDSEFSTTKENSDFIKNCEEKFAEEKKNMVEKPDAAAERIHNALEATVTVSLSKHELSPKDIALATVTECMANNLKNGDMAPAMDKITKTHTPDELNRLQCQVRGVGELGNIAKKGLIAKGELLNTSNLSKEDLVEYSKDYLAMTSTDELMKPSKKESREANKHNEPGKSNALLALGAMPIKSPADFVNKSIGQTNVAKQFFELNQDQVKDLIFNQKAFRDMSKASVSQCVENFAKRVNKLPANEKLLLKSADQLEKEKQAEKNKQELKPVNMM